MAAVDAGRGQPAVRAKADHRRRRQDDAARAVALARLRPRLEAERLRLGPVLRRRRRWRRAQGRRRRCLEGVAERRRAAAAAAAAAERRHARLLGPVDLVRERRDGRQRRHLAQMVPGQRRRVEHRYRRPVPLRVRYGGVGPVRRTSIWCEAGRALWPRQRGWRRERRRRGRRDMRHEARDDDVCPGERLGVPTARSRKSVGRQHQSAQVRKGMYRARTESQGRRRGRGACAS